MCRFLFDTNALNAFLDFGVQAADLVEGLHCCVTAAQVGELKATRRDSRRLALLEYFEELSATLPVQRESLRSGPFGTSPFGEAPFGGGEGRYFKTIMDQLEEIPGNRSKRGNTTDALTLEVCFYENTTLVTDDPSLTAVAQSYDVEVLSFVKFIERNGRDF